MNRPAFRPELSIVTALHNHLDLTRAFLESLERHPPTIPWEIIWVDDGSTDGTRDWLGTLTAPHHRVILNEQNLGFAGANNRGARASTARLLTFLNNDLILQDGWFAPMLSGLNRTALPGFVGNVQLDAASGRVDHAGIWFNLIGTGEHHLRGQASPPTGEGDWFPAITAACCLIERDTFLEADGFDESYRNGYEDLDLCLRLSHAGRRHWVSYHSIVHHHIGASRGHQESPTNRQRFLSRWGKETALLGRAQWPAHYLRKYRHAPYLYNPGKLLDALCRRSGLRHGPSAWAEKERARLLQLPAPTA